MKVSVIIIAYNMVREIQRTVQTFLPPYQTDVPGLDVEIIVLDNGSPEAIPASVHAAWPDNVRYLHIDPADPSPVKALNAGAAMSTGDWICPVIDGARFVTPNFFAASFPLMRGSDNPVIATLGYHLGHTVQQRNPSHTREAEDALLASIHWPDEPYAVFDISCLGESAQGGVLQPIAESNVLILKKELYNSIGGYDEGFTTPGGGLANLAFFRTLVEHPSTDYFLLMGEASFHQVHRGVTTSKPVSEPDTEKGGTQSIWDSYAQEYEAVCGRPFAVSDRLPTLIGKPHPHVVKALARAAAHIGGNE